ncbi:MAG: DUF4402 domain-containing protein [Sphingomonadaceae bacterium]|nr:DUF4402 domain-containing protein [Sphingomonadaceae bacterium]
MNRSWPFALTLLAAQTLHAECRLCAPAPETAAKAPAQPLEIEIEAGLDFSRAAHRANTGGTIAVDERSGGRTIGGGLIDLGGLALKGQVRLTGAPFARVRISLPPSIRLSAPNGGSAEVSGLETDLGPDPALDAQGRLSFSFGGRLIVAGGASGDFRGLIPITADYR